MGSNSGLLQSNAQSKYTHQIEEYMIETQDEQVEDSVFYMA